MESKANVVFVKIKCILLELPVTVDNAKEKNS